MNKQEAIDALECFRRNAAHILGDSDEKVKTIETCMMLVREAEEAPSAQPEQKKGKWIHERLCSSTGGTYPVTRCSVCQNALPFEWETQYCPNCGAKMEGVNCDS